MRGFSLILMGTAPLLAGCMLPVYQHPAGFSSTYFRHLHAAQPIPPIAAWSTPVRPPEISAPREWDPGVVHPLLID